MRFLIFIFFFISSPLFAQDFILKKVETGTDSHFRGLSVVDDHTAWVSGSKGTFGRTSNGGKSWKFQQIRNFENLEFRSLYAFDSLTAVVANAGAPAFILRTTDGGANWKTVYTNENKEAFIDGMDFWNNTEGVVYGDAIESRMLLLMTHDGGMSWKEMDAGKRPLLKNGEGSFAASGTGIRCLENKKVIIATGGKTSRLWTSDNKGSDWNAVETPIVQGEVMTGIFSVAFKDSRNWIIVGGNYEKDTVKTDHIFYTRNAGKVWERPQHPTGGIRECVEYIDKNIIVAVGYGGIDISYNNGLDWKPLADEKLYSVIRKSRKGNLIVLAGGKGKLSLLQKRK